MTREERRKLARQIAKQESIVQSSSTSPSQKQVAQTKIESLSSVSMSLEDMIEIDAIVAKILEEKKLT